MTGHLRCRRSFQCTSEPKEGAATLLGLCEPSGFFTLQLNLSWRHSRSSLAWPLFFQLRPLQASLTCFWRPQQGSRIDIGERGDWPVSVGEDRQNSVALETSEHHQPLLNDLLAVSLVTGKRKMWRKLSVGRTWKTAKRLLAWQGFRWRRAPTRMSRTSQSEKTETWCSLIADTLAQNKPVVSSRHHHKVLKRDRKTTRQTARQLQLRKERLSSSAAASHFPHASDCAATVTTTLATVICPVTNPDNNFASCLLSYSLFSSKLFTSSR